jgi:CPA1 family monovalent cation:H+ antiporter
MRGIVSLAAALSLPVVLSNPDTRSAGRNLIIYLTFSVIVVTLLAQGLTLPWVIRLLKVRDDGEDDRDEEVMARYLTALAAVERLDELSNTGGEQLPTESFRRVRNEYDGRLAYYSRQLNTQLGPSRKTGIGATDGSADDDAGDEICTTEHQLRRNALSAERSMLLKLRDNGTIADDILRRVQQSLDLEESRLDAE